MIVVSAWHETRRSLLTIFVCPSPDCRPVYTQFSGCCGYTDLPFKAVACRFDLLFGWILAFSRHNYAPPISLSRKLAQQNHYPAIDILASVSRCQSAIIPKDHKAAAAKLRALLAKYAEVELLLKIGEYKKGSDPETDEAIAKNAAVNAFLKQALDEKPTYEESIQKFTGHA